MVKKKNALLWLVPALALGACSDPPTVNVDLDAATGDLGTTDVPTNADTGTKRDVGNGDATRVDVVPTDNGIIPDDAADAGDDASGDAGDDASGDAGDDAGGDAGDDAGGDAGDDAGVVDTDTGATDSGVVDTDTGVTDSGVVDTDTGATDSGADAGADVIVVPPPVNNLPADALTLNLATQVVTVTGSTVGATNEAGCRTGGDVFYRFTLTRREVIYVNTFGSAYDTTVALTNLTGTQLTGQCNDDSSCGGLQSSLTAVLDPGTYLVAVGGFNGATGAHALNFNHLPVGNGPAVAVADTGAGVRSFTGTTAATGVVAQSCGGSGAGPENTYYFTTCPAFLATSLTASTCGGAAFDTVVEQRSTNRATAACADDSAGCGARSSSAATLPAGAGLHTVYVDGFSASALGAYSLSLAFGGCAAGQTLCTTGGCTNLQTSVTSCGACGTVCAAGLMCNAGACTPPPPANDLPANAVALTLATPTVTVTGSTAGSTNQAGCLSGGDVFYSFTLTGREVVWVNTFGSAYDTSVAITNAAGTQLTGQCNDDSCGGLQSSVATALDPGTYLVAVGGAGSTGAFTLNVSHLPAGNGPAVAVTNTTAGVRSFTGTTAGTSALAQSCGGSGGGPENTYFFVTCPNFAGSAVTASTCGGAAFDTVVEQRSTNRPAAACADDSSGCGARSSSVATLPAGAGLHTVYVDGFGSTALGDYALSVSFGGCAAGQTLCTTGGCTNLQTSSTSCGTCGTVCGAGLVCNAGTCSPPAPGADLPANAITLDLSTPTVTTLGSTAGATNQSGCGSGGDVYYRFTLAQREIVEVDTFDTGYDSTVAITNTAGVTVSGLCADDSCAVNDGQVASVLDAGTYLVAVGGFGGATGGFTMTLRHLPVGGITPVQIASFPTTSTAVTGTTVGGTSAFASTSCQGNAGGNDVSYWFATCPNFVSVPFTASTCTGTSFDTILTLRNTGAVAACGDDSCLTQSTVTSTLPGGANLYTLNLDGWSTSSGPYTLTYRFAP